MITETFLHVSCSLFFKFLKLYMINIRCVYVAQFGKHLYTFSSILNSENTYKLFFLYYCAAFQ